MDTAFDNTALFVGMLKARSASFELAAEPRGLNICFWYNPGWLRDLPVGSEKRAELYTLVTGRVCNQVSGCI